MMGHQQVEQAALFYEFSLEKHVPADHLCTLVANEGSGGSMNGFIVPASPASPLPEEQQSIGCALWAT